MRPVSVGVNPTAATLTTVYTVPTGYYAKFTVMYIHNTGGSTKHITVQWIDTSTSMTYDILTEYTLSAKNYLQFDGNAYIVLEEGDAIKITTESGSVGASSDAVRSSAVASSAVPPTSALAVPAITSRPSRPSGSFSIVCPGSAQLWIHTGVSVGAPCRSRPRALVGAG